MNPEDIHILILCEESQAVCIELRKLGFQAYSCDLLPCPGSYPEWHYQCDAFIALMFRHWHLVISFQPCTHLASSGATSFEQKRDDGRQEEGIRLFFEIWKHSDSCENPVGILNGGKYVKQWFPALHQEMLDYGFPFRPSQIINPFQFGDAYIKKTCLWLKYLPALLPTDKVQPVANWTSGSDRGGPRKDGTRKKSALPCLHRSSFMRSKTFPGIAKAMAEQWGSYLLKKAEYAPYL